MSSSSPSSSVGGVLVTLAATVRKMRGQGRDGLRLVCKLMFFRRCCTGLDEKVFKWLRDFLPMFPKIAVRQTAGGCGEADGNSKPCNPTQYFNRYPLPKTFNFVLCPVHVHIPSRLSRTSAARTPRCWWNLSTLRRRP